MASSETKDDPLHLRDLACRLALEADRANAEARETKAQMEKCGGHGVRRPLSFSSNTDHIIACLRPRRAQVVSHWARCAANIGAGQPTIFGNDERSMLAKFPALFDAILATMSSKAEPPSTATLQELCDQAVKGQSIESLRHTTEAIGAFEEAAMVSLRIAAEEQRNSASVGRIDSSVDVPTSPSSPPREASTSGGRVDSRGTEQEWGVALRSVLYIVQETTKNIWERRNGAQGDPLLMLVEARESLADAREALLATIEQARQLVPSAPRIKDASTVADGIVTCIDSAVALRKMAQRLVNLMPEEQDDSDPLEEEAIKQEEAQQQAHHDIRVALVQLLRKRKAVLSERWTKAIREQVRSYQATTADTQVSSELNSLVTNAMIHLLGPNGDAANLMYVCQRIAERRVNTMTQESVQHALRLFEDVAMGVYRESIQKGPYTMDLLALAQVDEGTVHAMISDVVFQSCRLLAREYFMISARKHDPRPPDTLFCAEGGVLNPQRIPEVMISAELGGQYQIDAYIYSGGWARGWRAVDKLNKDQDVFVKTFRSIGDKGTRPDKMVEELENCERVAKIDRLMRHPNVVRVIKVLRASTINVPRTGQSATGFHAVITDYCDGGELFNYIVVNNPAGGVKPISFTEPQARFLFRQIVSLLSAMHIGDDASERYYHGDLKEQNMCVQGSTLKLIDYGTLQKVPDQPVQVSHATRSYQTPYHNSPEAVDLWAAGVMLFNMVAVAQTRDIQCVYRNRFRLQQGTFWSAINKCLGEGHPLKREGPDTLQNLLSKIFATAPQNSLKVSDIVDHPWLKGDVPTAEEMEAELKSRYAGIRSGTPPGTFFFVLPENEPFTKSPALTPFQRMEKYIRLACSHQRRGQKRYAVGDVHPDSKIMVECWDSPNEVAQTTDRWDDEDGTWVLARYSCRVAAAHEEDRKGHRIQLHWDSGGSVAEYVAFAEAVEHVFLGKH